MTFNRATGLAKKILSPKHDPINYRANKPLPNGELYTRPLPNPFTPEYKTGYNDGYDGEPYCPSLAGGQVQNYRAGFVDGQEQLALDQTEFNETSSSNA